MAQGDSIVAICNAALLHLGEDLIVALTDNTKRAILCNARYDPVRRRVLRSFPWNCAKAQAQLAAAAAGPLFDWDFGYPLPADYLRMFDQSHDDDDQPQWELIGTQIFSDDQPPLEIVYVRDLTDPVQMDALLVEVLALELAADLAEPLTQSTDKLKGVLTKLGDRRSLGRLVSSQENSPREWDEDVWLRARR